MENKIVYLDNAATTVPSKEVVALYSELESKCFGNASSIHKLGVESLSYLNKARETILSLLNVKNHKVYFTGSSTEANNLAIKGYCYKYAERGKHIITSNVEHASVIECFKSLEKEGFKVKVSPLLYENERFLAGDDNSRKSELMDAFNDDEIDYMHDLEYVWKDNNIKPHWCAPKGVNNANIEISEGKLRCLNLEILNNTLIDFME